MKATKTFDRRILDRLIQELLQAGLHVTSGEGEFAVLKLRPYRTKGGHTTVLIDGKGPSRRFKSVPVNDEHLLYAVFPREGWREHVLACVEKNDESWVKESNLMGEKMESIFQRNGYRAGSVGGIPANIDFSSPDGQAIFSYIGNPFHT
jgi:hypothetical protein